MVKKKLDKALNPRYNKDVEKINDRAKPEGEKGYG